MYRWTLTAAVAVLFLGAQAGAWGAEGLSVEWRDGALSVSARHVPLNTLLSEVAERTGVELSLSGELSEPVSVQFNAAPLRDGLGHILMSAGVSYALVEYHDGDSAATSIALLVGGKKSGQVPSATAGFDPIIPPPAMFERFRAGGGAAAGQPPAPIPAPPPAAGTFGEGMAGALSPEVLQTLRERMAAIRNPPPQKAPEAQKEQAAQPSGSDPKGPPGAETQPAAKAPAPAPSTPPTSASPYGGFQPFSTDPAMTFGAAPAPQR